jgi:transposase
MSNALSEEKRQQVIALGRLGWPLRRIEQETGVRRETASAYLKAAGIAVRPPRAWGRRPPAKPANEVITGFGVGLGGVDSNGHSPTVSACEPFREAIELGLSRGRNAMAVWQDLVADHGFRAGYLSVQRFVRRLRGNQAPEARAVICTAPGEEGQVDYGNKGPMVRDERTGKYRRTRLFVMTLGHSRKAVRLLTFQSSSRIWAELHEKAFRRLGGTPRVIVLDFVPGNKIEVLWRIALCGRVRAGSASVLGWYGERGT